MMAGITEILVITRPDEQARFRDVPRWDAMGPEKSYLRMTNSFLVFAAPSIEQAKIDGIEAVMKSEWLGTGQRTR